MLLTGKINYGIHTFNEKTPDCGSGACDFQGFPMTSASAYAQNLRAIGQALEDLHLEILDLQADGNEYLVRGRVEARRQDRHGLKAAWQRLRGQDSQAAKFRYTPLDVDRLEMAGQLRRRDPNGMPDPYSLSSILRSVGASVDLMGARLLRVTKRNQWLTIQYETALGGRNLDERTVSSLYDFFVHMYLHRSNRHTS